MGQLRPKPWCVFLSVIAEVHEGSESKWDVSCPDPDRAVISAISCRRKQVGWQSPEPKGWRCACRRWSRGRAAACSPPGRSPVCPHLCWALLAPMPSCLVRWREHSFGLSSGFKRCPFQRCKEGAILPSVKCPGHLCSWWSSGCAVAEYPRLSSLGNKHLLLLLLIFKSGDQKSEIKALGWLVPSEALSWA